jgi:tRNA threonylcarbamoyladenosine biosynthesis protein TsaE
MKRSERVATEADMERLGERLAGALKPGSMIYFHGALGAGKTTLIRGILHGLGHSGAVKSPTFTLVEAYVLPAHTVYHFDFYRLHAAEELEFFGIRDYLQGQGICLIEWAERGDGLLPEPDVDVYIDQADHGRSVQWVSHTDSGNNLLDGLT